MVQPPEQDGGPGLLPSKHHQQHKPIQPTTTPALSHRNPPSHLQHSNSVSWSFAQADTLFNEMLSDRRFLYCVMLKFFFDFQFTRIIFLAMVRITRSKLNFLISMLMIHGFPLLFLLTLPGPCWLMEICSWWCTTQFPHYLWQWRTLLSVTQCLQPAHY